MLLFLTSQPVTRQGLAVVALPQNRTHSARHLSLLLLLERHPLVRAPPAGPPRFPLHVQVDAAR